MKFFHLIMCCMTVFISNACAQQSDAGREEHIAKPYTPLSETELQQLNEQQLLNAKQMSASALTYFVTKVANNKYGYTVFVDGQLYIEQNTIPAKDGTVGFNTIEDAEGIARLVIKKLGDGEIPPTITLQELKEHGIE